MLEVTLTFPWPNSGLVPHAKGNWRKKAKLTKAARAEAYKIALADRLALRSLEEPLGLWIEFYPPDKRPRDVMNTIAACKAMIDGIADAVGCDDGKFENHWPSVYCESREGGAVVIRFRPGTWGRATYA
jgi:crossover junction endodeoxyribonuclease RusA